MGTKKATILFTALFAVCANAQLAQDLVLEDPEDIKLLMDEFPTGEASSGKAKAEGLEGLVVDDLEELSRSLEQTEYKDVIQKGFEEFKEKGSLITLETELYKYLLKQSILLLHQHPLSVNVILGYMFAKDIEVRNLKIIVKGKQLGLSEDFIESQLVF